MFKARERYSSAGLLRPSSNLPHVTLLPLLVSEEDIKAEHILYLLSAASATSEYYVEAAIEATLARTARGFNYTGLPATPIQ